MQRHNRRIFDLAHEWSGPNLRASQNRLEARGEILLVYEETPLFFKNGAHRLFGILHAPNRTVERNEGFVFCYPCFEEKLWVQRVFVRYARELAHHGYWVLRFDFMGHGDSDGDFEGATVASRVSDLTSAVDFLRQRLNDGGRVSLLGLRLGAAIAALFAERDPSISRLVLWDPVMDGKSYFQDLLLSNLATQTAVHGKIVATREDLAKRLLDGKTVNVEGYEIGPLFFREICDVQLSGKKSFAGPCLVVQIGRAHQGLRRDLADLAAAYQRGTVQQVVEQPFWKELKLYYPAAAALFSATTSWAVAEK